jgi:Ca2+-binding EF-hand superfamily protein
MNSFRIAVRRLAVTLALAGVGFAAGRVRADPAAQVPPGDRDAHDLVLLAPAHPVFIRMSVQVDGRGLKAVRTEYAAQLVKQYDKNGDGLLNREEAKAMPPLVKSQNANEMVAIADRWEAVDVNPADDSVSLDELAAYVDRVFGSTFLLSVKPARATQNVDLFSLLDLNHDGRLSRDELSVAPQTLHKLDIDDDETFTVDELQPYRNPQVPQAPAQPANQATDQPFLLVEHDDESIAKVAQQLQQRYGEATPGAGSLSISREVLGIDAAAFTTHDVDGDGRLDAQELAAILRNPVPQVVIEAQLSQSKKTSSKLIAVEDHLGAAAKPMPGVTPKLALDVSGVSMELRLPPNKASADKSDNRNFFRQKFLEADRDKNKYISEQEFPGLPLQGADFKSVDRNGDGMIVVDELLAYVEQESTSSQSRVEMSISHEGSSVFEVIDTNRDRRLSRRELFHAFDLLRSYDRDGDESITAVELAGRFTGTLELGRPMLFRGSGPGARGGDMTNPVVNAPTAGPEWFRRMDRNHDGDVSWREFLGPLAAFKKLDADGDGLITAAEAEMAGEGQTAGAR